MGKNNKAVKGVSKANYFKNAPTRLAAKDARKASKRQKRLKDIVDGINLGSPSAQARRRRFANIRAAAGTGSIARRKRTAPPSAKPKASPVKNKVTNPIPAPAPVAAPVIEPVAPTVEGLTKDDEGIVTTYADVIAATVEPAVEIETLAPAAKKKAKAPAKAKKAPAKAKAPAKKEAKPKKAAKAK